MTKQYFVDFNENGNIEAFYVGEIHDDNIPESALPITEQQWQTYVVSSFLYKKAEEGDEPARLKTQAELDAEHAAQPPMPETDPEKIARLEAENSDLTARLSDVELALADIFTGGGE